MSLESWKKEFYPVEPSKRMTKRQAIEHSILKWRGFFPSSLKRHSLVLDKGSIRGKDELFRLRIDASSCALCVKYFNEDAVSLHEYCDKCPLKQHLGCPCDRDAEPFSIWMDTNDPKPMIKALKELLEKTK